MEYSNKKPGSFDNLISLKPGFNGPQLAGWTPGPPVKTGLGCKLSADQMIPVASGISLAADIYTPKKEGRYPAILAYSAYSKELQSSGAPTGTNETGSPPVFTDRGYAHVIVARRGMGRSEGESTAFCNDTDTEDHIKVIAWIAEQPWCDGNVVLFGTSYYAMVQPLAATQAPSALKAFFAIETCTDFFRHIVMFGGAPQTDFLALWMGANFTETQFRLKVPPVLRASLSHIFNSPLQRWWWPQVQKRLTRIMKGFQKLAPTKAMREFWAQVVIDGKTRATSAMPKGSSSLMDKITVPFVVVQNPGHFNLHQFGAYDLFENAKTAKNKKWLIIGSPEYELPCLHWQKEALAFYDYILFSAANGYGEQAPVRYWRVGANDYRTASNFPIENSRVQKFYLCSNGPDKNTHSLQDTPPTTGTNRWAAVPIGGVVPAGFDEVENQMLSYEYKFEEDAEFSGPVTANLLFSSNEIDSHIIARLGKVDSQGNYEALSLGSLRPACRKIDPSRSTAIEIAIDIDVPVPLVRGEPVQLKFSLTPQPVQLKKGESLRFDVASRTDLLISDQSHGRAQFEMQVPPYYSRNNLHYGQNSYIELWKI